MWRERCPAASSPCVSLRVTTGPSAADLKDPGHLTLPVCSDDPIRFVEGSSNDPSTVSSVTEAVGTLRKTQASLADPGAFRAPGGL